MLPDIGTLAEPHGAPDCPHPKIADVSSATARLADVSKHTAVIIPRTQPALHWLGLLLISHLSSGVRRMLARTLASELGQIAASLFSAAEKEGGALCASSNR